MTLALSNIAEDTNRWIAGDAYELPAPNDRELALALDGLIGPIADALRDTRLEDMTEDLAWAIVNVFHRKAVMLAKRADENADEVRQLTREQDGSEVADMNLQTAMVRGHLLDEAHESFEAIRDYMAEHYDRETGRAWFPRSGSMTGKTVTAATIDAKSFLAAKRQERVAAHRPDGTYVAVTGGPDYQDHVTIWNRLDRTHARFPDMVLLHGGNRRGTEHIASAWARARKVTQIVFSPDFKAHGKAAPFRRNDEIIDAKPEALVVFPGNGISENLHDKARAKNIKTWRIAEISAEKETQSETA
ncbi:MAG: DUF2493 domain-containing protein [Pseudomonadota bacterium]